MTTTTDTIIKGIDVNRLYVDSIDIMSIDYSWSDHHNVDIEGGETGWRSWEYRQPDEGDTSYCYECAGEIEYDGDEWLHVNGADDADDDHDVEPDPSERQDLDGPMMNYWYPLGIFSLDPMDAAKIIADLPLCIVEVDGEYGLALTGGGMDLSWEICEAYMRLGSLPPANFAYRLPKMAERFTDRHRLVLAGARRTAQISRDWALSALERLDDTEAWYQGREQ